MVQKITEKCLPPILQLKHLEELVLEHCLGIDDEGLKTLKASCNSMKVPLLVFHLLAGSIGGPRNYTMRYFSLLNKKCLLPSLKPSSTWERYRI